MVSPVDLWKWRGRAFPQGTARVNTEAGSCFILSALQTLRSPARLEQRIKLFEMSWGEEEIMLDSQV